MNGFISRALPLAGVALFTSVGCVGGDRYRDWVDPCYPERYNHTARAETISYFGPQVQNGHILDQTIWNYHFVTGTAELHPGGMEKLDYLIRRRPFPDPRLFLQTARDIAFDPAVPEEFVDARSNLDQKRVYAIQEYLAAQTASRGMNFEVLIHDPAPTGISGEEATLALSRFRGAAQGALTGGGGGAGGGGGGLAPGGGTNTGGNQSNDSGNSGGSGSSSGQSNRGY